jgi:hypothetical protein
LTDPPEGASPAPGPPATGGTGVFRDVRRAELSADLEARLHALTGGSSVVHYETRVAAARRRPG